MSTDTRFAGLLGAWPPSDPPPLLDPAQGQMQGLLPAQASAQPTIGLLDVPGDPSNLFGPSSLDPMSLISGGQGPAGGSTPLDADGWLQALQALHASLRGTQLSLQGSDPSDAASAAFVTAAPSSSSPSASRAVPAKPPASDLAPQGGVDGTYEVAGGDLAPLKSNAALTDQKALQVLAARAGDPSIHYDPKLGTIGRYVPNPASVVSFSPLSAGEIQRFKEQQLGSDSFLPGVKSPQEQFLDAQVADPHAQVSSPGQGDHQFQPGDQNLLARMIFAETGGIPDDYPAIGWAIANRLGTHEYGQTLSDVLQRKNAFQFIKAGGGPAGGSSLWQATADPSKLTDGNAASWAQAQRVAAGIVDGSIPDPTGGATLFFSSDHYTPGIPMSATGGFKSMLGNNTISPSAYQSHSHGRSRNYFFVEGRP